MLHLHLSDVAAQEHVALSVSVRAMSVSAMREVPAGKHCPHSRSPSITFCEALGDGLLDGPEEEVVEGCLFCCR